MLKRFLVFGLGTSLAQVVIFYFLIFMVYWFAAAIAISYPQKESDPKQDYAVLFIAIVFVFLVVVQNVLAATLNRPKATYFLIAIAIAAYLFSVIDLGSLVFFKSALCSVFGALVLAAKTKIDDLLAKWWLS